MTPAKQLNKGVRPIFLTVLALMFLMVFVTAYIVGSRTANPRLTRHVRLTEAVLLRKETELERCSTLRSVFRRGDPFTAEEAITELRHEKNEVEGAMRMERELTASLRSLLQRCEDAVQELRQRLFGVVDSNVTEKLRILQQKRQHLKSMYSKLTANAVGGSVELHNRSDARQLEMALLHELGVLTSVPAQIVVNKEVCQQSDAKYSVIFDLGSTGNRVHVYKYTVSARETAAGWRGDDLSEIDLSEELFALNHDALSRLPNPVKDAPAALQDLFEKAKAFVPRNLQACTPVEFKATAGLRMLDAETAASTLAAIRDHYRNGPFWMRGSAPVRILDGHEEGPLAWLTVNFLLGAFHRNVTTPTVAVIDLGGGSTQLVFEPGTNVFPSVPTASRYTAALGRRHVHAYQHSYEGYGLHAATQALLLHVQGKHQERRADANDTAALTTTTARPMDGDDAPYPPENVLGTPGGGRRDRHEGGDAAADATTVAHYAALPRPPPPQLDVDIAEAFPCFAVGYADPSGVKNTQTDDGGAPTTTPNLDACANLFRDRLLKPMEGVPCPLGHCGIAGVHQPPLANFTGDIHVFSFFFDLLERADGSLLPPSAVVSTEKFEVTLADVEAVARGHCTTHTMARIEALKAKGGLGTLKPEYECLYYAYAYALLRYGYQVPGDRVLHVTKKIRGFEAAWSLGASLISLS